MSQENVAPEMETATPAPVASTPSQPVERKSKTKFYVGLAVLLLLLCLGLGAAFFRIFGYAEANDKCLFVGKYSVEVPKDSACYDEYLENNEDADDSQDADESDDADSEDSDDNDTEEETDDTDESNDLDSEEYADFIKFEAEGYSILYPSDWSLQEGSIPVISEVELGTNAAGTFNPNLNIVSQTGYDGRYTQSVCESVGESAASGNQDTYDSIEVAEVDLIDTDYADNVCEIQYDAAIQGIPLTFKQHVFTSQEANFTVVLTLIADESDVEDFATLEKIAETIRLED